MLKKLICSILAIIPCMHCAHAQDDIFDADEQVPDFCTTGTPNMAPTKAISIDHEVIPEFNIKSTSSFREVGEGIREIESHSRFKFKLKVPLLNKESWKMVAGIKYSREKLLFEDNTDPNADHVLYDNLNDNTLKSAGFSLYLLKLINSKYYVITRTNMGFNGDFGGFINANGRYISGSFSSILGIKLNENVELGAGLSYSYDLGYHSIYPIFVYNHTLNDRWGIEMVLPIKAHVRYNASPTTYLYAGSSINGGSYLIDAGELSPEIDQRLRMSQSEIRFGLELKQEVMDPLWIGIDLGYRKVLGVQFNEVGSRRRDPVIESDVFGGGFYVNVSMYIVPPKGLLGKKKKSCDAPKPQAH